MELTAKANAILNGVHKKSNENKIFTTSDYKIFGKILGNRVINIPHFNRLKKSMQDHDLMIPIIVNEKLEVIDGQHRLQCRAELKLPVYYIIINGLDIKDTQKANLNNKNWNTEDFLNFYVKQNYHHYKVFKEFKEKYQFTIQISIALLASQSVKLEEFANGEFMVINHDRAVDYANKIFQLEQYYKGFKRRSFVFSILRCLQNESFDWEDFMQKVSYQSSKLVDCTSVDTYLRVIEDIYNYKRKIEDKIRLS